MKSGIYKITNAVNGRVYIGKAKYVQARWKRHIRELTQNKHHNKHLQADWATYGQSAFSFELIEQCKDNPEILNNREAFWMRAYETYTKGYNILTDKNDFSGLKHSEETKEKMRQKRNDWYKNHPEYKEKISQLRKEEWSSGKRTSKQNQGRVVSNKTKEKLSIIFKARYAIGESTPNLVALSKGRATRKLLTQEDPDRFRKFKAETRKDIVQKYEELITTFKKGESQEMLAKEYDTNSRTIRTILKEEKFRQG